QPSGIQEARELHLPQLFLVSSVMEDRADHAFGADRQLRDAFGNDNLRLQVIAVGSDQVALRGERERAVARVGDLIVRTQDLEEAVSLDEHVQRIAGLLRRALAELAIDGGDCRSVSDGHLRRWSQARRMSGGTKI